MAENQKDGLSIYQLKVTIKYIRPPVWRRLQISRDITLASLHDVLQTAFGWTDSHLHQFVIGDTYYGIPTPYTIDWGPSLKNETRARLGDTVGRSRKKFLYGYDFGDSWEHEIIVEKVVAPEASVAYPRCVAGKRACPPEDCGGAWGYAHLLEKIQDAEHPDHEEICDWLGDEFDAEAFDLEAVNARLQPGPRHR